MRPELIDEVSRAAGDLERLSGRPWYTDRHLEGLGKNVMSEEARVDGLSAYRTCLRRYGLRAAFARLLAGRSLDPPPDGADPEWLHASRVLTATGLDPDPIAVVRMHAAETTAWAESVADCKRRDDERGARIIEDYADVHPAADLDEVVIRGLDIARDTQTDADRLLRSMGLS